MPNMYGDIVSDLAAALVGGIGLAPGANFGDDVAVFEAAHGTAPRHAGHRRANPLGLLLSGVLMLRHVGEHVAAERIEVAVAGMLATGTTPTYDLLREADQTPASTNEVADALIARLT